MLAPVATPDSTFHCLRDNPAARPSQAIRRFAARSDSRRHPERVFQRQRCPLPGIDARTREVNGHHRHAQPRRKTGCRRFPVRGHHATLVVQEPGDALGQRARGIFQHQRRPVAQRVIAERAFHCRQRMIAGDNAGPAQHPHIAKRIASPNGDRLRCPNCHLHPAIRQRIPLRR